MMRDRYGAKNERSWFMKTHVQTAGCSLTEQQPLNNIVRVAYQAMAACSAGARACTRTPWTRRWACRPSRR
jgi:methylmalonyl-CoA mutase N-terminal domain/subunit